MAVALAVAALTVVLMATAGTEWQLLQNDLSLVLTSTMAEHQDARLHGKCNKRLMGLILLSAAALHWHGVRQ